MTPRLALTVTLVLSGCAPRIQPAEPIPKAIAIRDSSRARSLAWNTGYNAAAVADCRQAPDTVTAALKATLSKAARLRVKESTTELQAEFDAGRAQADAARLPPPGRGAAACAVFNQALAVNIDASLESPADRFLREQGAADHERRVRREREAAEMRARDNRDRDRRWAAVNAEIARNREATDAARTAGRTLGQALSCYRITRGDVRYAQSLIERRLGTDQPTASIYAISRAFADGQEAGERSTVGPSDYDCPEHATRAALLLVQYDVTLRRPE